jgi:hypothetical protein
MTGELAITPAAPVAGETAMNTAAALVDPVI